MAGNGAVLLDELEEVGNDGRGTTPASLKGQRGEVCQYSVKNHCYVPVRATVPVLPAGCYRVRRVDMAGELGLSPVRAATDMLIRFPDSTSEDLIEEIERFWRLKDDYRANGLSHKRGYLLWGPPGSGKSCTIAVVVANHLKRDGVVMLVDVPGTAAAMLQLFRMVEPIRPLLLVWEDMESMTAYERWESESLAVLDGESQVEDVVFIATTNYPEKLDKRLVNRPGRFDRVVKIGLPDERARALYLESKMGSTTAPDGTDLVGETRDFSFGHLREMIVGIRIQGKSPAEVIERLRGMKVLPKSSAGNGIGFGEEN